MPKSLNVAEVIGVVGRDPEVKTSTAGLIAIFSVATHESFKGRDGQWQERTDWHHVVTFGPNAEIVRNHIKKGMRVSARGKMKNRTWEHAKYPGVMCSRTEIIADLVSPLLTLPTRAVGSSEGTVSAPISARSSDSDNEFSDAETEFDSSVPF